MSRNNGEVRLTVNQIDFTDVVSTTKRIEELRKQLTEREQAASRARHDLESFEQAVRNCLKNQPELLIEFEAELAEMTRRNEEHTAREARIKALRK